MSGGMSVSEGLQVVKLGQGGERFELDSAALQQVLLKPEVRHLPVVLVSVAGAYRGGKSFMLDFFLRYLNAPRASQLSGEWLGLEDDPLKGFHWRGGCERDTTGIHLWPHPIITTLESTGEKVAVLLMDTQGTFDSETTIGQNSTIFALSTLISSVQIYNLSGNIREDDLQHLQLFTEYGKLACGGEGKAFQMLTFLVRDWMSEYDHPHGFGGGEALLNKRLQSHANQRAELREVREHICSCFDEIKCFLMPHPGLSVANRTFTGCLRDLSEKFRLALLEFVPSLFDPQHLTPKLINGERVRAQDLIDYFQKYVDIFNSDEVPQAVTIFKATADACMQAASRSARELYSARMAERVRAHVSVPPRAVADWHAAAAAHALQHYQGKRKLGSQEDIQTYFQELEKELDASLSVYMWNNDAKVRDTMSQAKEAYDGVLSRVCAEQARICLHPQDLQQLHKDAVHEALALFDAAREVPDNEEDEKRTELVRSFEEQLKHLCAINEQNNRSAGAAARDAYVSQMKLQLDVAGVSTEHLQEQHDALVKQARAHFAKHRHIATAHPEDPHLHRLLEEIDHCFVDFKKANKTSNVMAMHAMESVYSECVTAEWGPPACCLHPRALADLHVRAQQTARAHLLAHRPHSEQHSYIKLVDEVLEKRYSELKRNNEYNNNKAVEQAFTVYTLKMDKYTQPSLVSIFIAPFLVKLLAVLPTRQDECRELARKHFFSMRRGPRYDDDCYYDELMEKIDAAYETYRDPAEALLRELGIRR